MNLLQFAAIVGVLADLLQIFSTVIPFVQKHPIISLMISNTITLVALYVLFQKIKKDRAPSHDRSAA
jgi:ABC-type nickel/cobalt efflux system permease component RcnA